MDVQRKQAQEIAGLGAVIEHEIAMYQNDHIFPISVLVDWINLIGPEHTSLGSDLGQVGNPLPVEAYTEVVGRLLDSGIAEKDVRLDDPPATTPPVSSAWTDPMATDDDDAGRSASRSSARASAASPPRSSCGSGTSATFTIFEQSAGVGGTWYDNRYPGCEVDVHSHAYWFSFLKYDWPRTHAQQPELLAYAEHVDDLRPAPAPAAEHAGHRAGLGRRDSGTTPCPPRTATARTSTS